jgi:hypothetical protein
MDQATNNLLTNLAIDITEWRTLNEQCSDDH